MKINYSESGNSENFPIGLAVSEATVKIGIE